MFTELMPLLRKRGLLLTISLVEGDTLRATVLSKVGDVYDEEALRRDFSALWKTGRFTDVQLKTEPGARGGVTVRFIVTERP